MRKPSNDAVVLDTKNFESIVPFFFETILFNLQKKKKKKRNALTKVKERKKHVYYNGVSLDFIQFRSKN